MLRKVLFACSLIAGLCIVSGQAADVGYTYDTLGRVVRVDYPNGNSVLYTYDAAGNRSAVSVSVLPAQPTAVIDTPETDQDTSKTYDPRVNDISGSAMTIIATGAPLHGGVVINGGITVTYTPASGYYGTDSFYYTISNGNGGQSSALDAITIHQTFPLPTAGPVSEQTNANTVVTFNPREHATGDGILLTGTPLASHGAVVNNSGVSLTYTPDTNYVGGDSFTYTVTDVHSKSASNTVTMTVNAPTPPAPDCNQSFPNPPRTPRVFDCRADSSLTMTAITQPDEGVATLASDGTSITFTPAAGQCGGFDFSYTVKNIYNVTNTGTVHLSIGEPCP